MTSMLPEAISWPPEVAESYRRLGLWRGQTLSEALRQSAARSPEREAIVCGSRRCTYHELVEAMDRAAAGLWNLGLRAGDRVVVQMPNIVEFFEICGALFHLGVIPVLALMGHRQAEIGHFVRHVKARALITVSQPDISAAQLANLVAAEVDTLELVITVDESPPTELSQDAGVPVISYAELARSVPHAYAAPDASAIALFQLSGGSTGTPKLIARTHDDYLYSIRQSIEVCGFGPSTTYLATLPVAHNFPLSSPGALGALIAGGKVVLCPSPDPARAFDLIAREQVNVTAVVPSLLLVWLAAAARVGRKSLVSLKVLQVGGSRLEPQLARRVPEVLRCTLQQVYGMAEGLVCYTRLDDDPESIVETQGKPMSAWDEVIVVDENDDVVASDQVGELLTRGPYTIRGYFDAKDHNARAFTSDGFYRTGDLACLTRDGRIIIRGRRKDQIQRGGEKIAAPEVEAYLCRHPRITQAAVVPVPDTFLGERSCAFIVTDGPPLPRSELRSFFSMLGVAEYKFPDRVVTLSELPTTHVGKVDKRQLVGFASSPPLAPSSAGSMARS